MKGKLRRVALFLSLTISILYFASAFWAVQLARELCRMRELVGVGAPTTTDPSTSQTLSGLRGRIAEENGRYYGPGEMSAARFSRIVSLALRENNLRIERVLPGRKHNTTNETGLGYRYEVSGSVVDFLRFLRIVSSQTKYWQLDPVHLSTDTGHANIELEIGFLAHDSGK